MKLIKTYNQLLDGKVRRVQQVVPGILPMPIRYFFMPMVVKRVLGLLKLKYKKGQGNVSLRSKSNTN